MSFNSLFLIIFGFAMHYNALLNKNVEMSHNSIKSNAL
jgi:hypothetical protein